MRRMASDSCDLLIVGGGINGAGIARDAALRGLDVVLCERGDIAGATSSASTKLIHGGLRYLEQGAFPLVRESLQERAIVGRIAAHLVRPQRFVVPHTGERPAWMLALGLGIYDLLAAQSSLPASQRLPADFPLLRHLAAPVSGAHAYYDLRVDDARLTLANVSDAHRLGARVFTRRALVAVTADGGRWRCKLAGAGGEEDISARCVVNVAGPWMSEVEALRGTGPAPAVRLVQGTHIVVPRLHDGNDAWLLQQPDRRVVFVIPCGADFHLVGTTETALDSPAALGATGVERTYLQHALSRAFGAVPGRDIVWEFSGMRPLIGGQGSLRTASREYRLKLERHDTGRAWLTVQGGKLTTYRRLAERAVDRIAEAFGVSTPSSTALQPLPGAGTGAEDWPAWEQRLDATYPGLPAGWASGLLSRHGTLAATLIVEAMREGGAGRAFGGGMYEAEARWCARHEWAIEAGDVLWRRTKCGLAMTLPQREAFTRWWSDQRAA